MSDLKANGGRQAYEQSIARLFSGNISEEESANISLNREVDADFDMDFEAAVGVLADMEGLSEDIDILSIAEQPVLTFGERMHSQARRIMAVAAVMMISLGVLFMLPQAETEGTIDRYVTRIGEQRTVDLDDGSSLVLNTASQALVRYGEKQRHVTLIRGEAFFDVTPDPERPFVVEVGERSITVLGTQFGVHMTPDRYKVSVIEGVVAIHGRRDVASFSAPLIGMGGAHTDSTKGQRRLSAGWTAEYELSSGTLSAQRIEDVSKELGWRSGIIEFYDEPLVGVVKELNRYSVKKILIEDASIMTLNVYAGISVKDLRAALIGLERILPIKVTTHFDRIVIVGDDGGDK